MDCKSIKMAGFVDYLLLLAVAVLHAGCPPPDVWKASVGDLHLASDAGFKADSKWIANASDKTRKVKAKNIEIVLLAELSRTLQGASNRPAPDDIAFLQVITQRAATRMVNENMTDGKNLELAKANSRILGEMLKVKYRMPGPVGKLDPKVFFGFLLRQRKCRIWPFCF